MIDNNQDNTFIKDKQHQLKAENCFCKELNIDKIDITNTIASFKLTNLIPDKIMNKYAGNLLKNLINIIFIFQYLNFIDNYKDSTRLEYLSVILLKFDLNLKF